MLQYPLFLSIQNFFCVEKNILWKNNKWKKYDRNENVLFVFPKNKPYIWYNDTEWDFNLA